MSGAALSRVRVAVVGAGFWAVANHIPELAGRDDVELVSVCRLGRPELDVIQRRFGFRIATEDVVEALDAGVDAAVICGPNDLHRDHALAAIERGLHVMVEKPLAPTAREAWAIVDAARARDLVALVPHGWHYKPFVRAAYELARSGALGEIRHVLCHMASPTVELFEGRGGYGTVEIEGLVFESSPVTWASTGHRGGYALGQMAHSVGLLCWLTDLRGASVSARSTASGTGVDVVDAAVVEFEGGALGSLSGCGLAPAHAGFQVDIRVFGSDGMLLLDVERERCVLRRHDGSDEIVSVQPGSGAYECTGPPHRFIELVRGLSDRNDSPAEASARAIEILEGLLRSAAERRTVAIGAEGDL